MNRPEDDIHLEVLRELESEPYVNQRSLAERLGLSLGKANYCLRALVDKGLVKINNFRRSDNKLAYAYVLTPAGIEERARLTLAFLRRKQREYEELQAQIAHLREEVDALRREPDSTIRSAGARRGAKTQ